MTRQRSSFFLRTGYLGPKQTTSQAVSLPASVAEGLGWWAGDRAGMS